MEIIQKGEYCTKCGKDEWATYKKKWCKTPVQYCKPCMDITREANKKAYHKRYQEKKKLEDMKLVD